MRTVQIRFNDISQVRRFVYAISGCPGELKFIDENGSINAHSILGIFSADLSRPLTLQINNCRDMDHLMEAIRPFME